jgi:uncharacterized repeat protein (TIGR03806 family)
MYVVPEPGSNFLLVIQQAGGDRPARIVRFDNSADVSASEVYFEAVNRLIYSLVFAPDFAASRQVYLFSNGPTSEQERQDRVTRYRVTEANPPRIDPTTEELILEWRSMGHDGGDMAFGLDGMLYITTGDGTSDSDGWNSGQTLNDLLGSVLRIDVRKPAGDKLYSVPADNPFLATPGALPEIWAYGLRNPWRMSIDPKQGHVWVGNNGQDLWETAHLIKRGDNLGWSVYEGSHPFYPERQRGPTPIVPPTIEHSHADFRSLTGGFVYYGDVLSDLEGAYIYGDYSSGRIWGMKHDGTKPIWHRELADTSLMIAGFAVDPRGELLIVDHGGGIYRLVPAKIEENRAPFPTRLSETGLFADVAGHKVAPGVIAYSINAPGWHDGAEAERLLAVPDDKKITYHHDRSWEFPDGTALVQTLSVNRAFGDFAVPKKMETRVLLRQQGEWAGYTYRWQDDQQDAILVPREGDDTTFQAVPSLDGPKQQDWRFPSRTECLTCHSRAANFVLGVSGQQLNRPHGGAQDQIAAFSDVGLFPAELPAGERPKQIDPHDTSADLEARARSYLQVNCAICHVAAGGGNARMELGLATPREKMELIEARPQHDTFGIANAMLVAPGEPDRSVLVQRISRRGPGQMPPLVSHRLDQEGILLLRQWIAGLKPSRPFVREWRMDDLKENLSELAVAGSHESGAKAFREIGCIQCHKIGDDGGSVGPNLTDVGSRLKPQELLEAIVEPSSQIADAFATWLVQTADGQVHQGQIEHEDTETLTLRAASAVDRPTVIAIADIEARRKSPTSNMPAGSINVLERAEILDLVAYLLEQRGSEPSSAAELPSEKAAVAGPD